jgi:HK97 family phage prohead protease
MPEFHPNIDGDGLLLREETLIVKDIDTRRGLVDVQMIPYEEQVELIPGVFEVFTRGAFDRQVATPSAWARVKMMFGHEDGQVPLGRATELQERDAGLGGVFQMNMRLVRETERGRSVWLAMENGDLDEVSIGFQSVRRGGTEVRTIPEGRLLRRVKAHLSHLALVPIGAYGQGARILAVRGAGFSQGLEPLVQDLLQPPTDPWADWKARIESHRGSIV